jgi:4a-hydroxytetrahydrobiopterin dehydratase
VPKLLSDAEVAIGLETLAGWSHRGKFITKPFEFDRFMDGIEFVRRVAEVAEREEHHPDIHIRYTKVTLMLQTHSEGGVTEWDIELARAIERMARGVTRKAPRSAEK